jgi:hypothetical protein
LIPELQDEPQRLFYKALELYQGTGITDKLEWFGFTLLTKQSNWMRAIPKDNGDFLAMVCVYSPNAELDILAVQTAITDCWEQVIAPYIYQEKTKLVLVA